MGSCSEKRKEVGVSEFVGLSKTDDPNVRGAEETLHLCEIFGKNAGDYRWNTHYFTNQEKYAKTFLERQKFNCHWRCSAVQAHPLLVLAFSLSVSAHAWALAQLLEADSLEAGLPHYEETIQAAFRRWTFENPVQLGTDA